MATFHTAWLFLTVSTLSSWVAATLTPAQQDQIAANIAALDTVLNQTGASAQQLFTSVAAGTMTKTCALNYACGAGSSNVTGYVPDFSAPIPTQYDYVQSKPYTAGSTPPDPARLCAMDQMHQPWKSSLAAGNGSIFYQYFAGSQNNFAVYPPTPWNCAASYVPTNRPYYVAGATGSKDLIILIDVSSDAEVSNTTAATRVANSVAAAVALLQTLSFADYVAVIPYADYPMTTVAPGLVQATVANVQMLVGLVQTMVTVVPMSNANPNAALTTSVNLLTTAKANSLGSGCTQTIVMLSSGFNDYQGTSVTAPLNGLSSPIITFAVYVSGDPQHASPSVPMMLRQVGCAGSGLALWGAASMANATAATLQFNVYLSSLVSITVPRWSEWYVDAFGQGNIISSALPVYTTATDGTNQLEGLVVQDMPLTYLTLGGQVDPSDVNLYLQNNDQCQAVNPSASSVLIGQLQGPSQCVGIAQPPAETPTAQRLKALFVIITVVVALVCIVAPIYIFTTTPTSAEGWSIIATGFAFVLWVTILAVFWSLVFDSLVTHASFAPVTFVVDYEAPNPSRCCQVVSCSCSDYFGTSCGSLIAQLKPGQCDNGYYCCSRSCYSCNCHSSGSGKKRHTTCSTCCYCSSWVNHHSCTVGCGTCYNPTITITYPYQGQSLTSHISRSCGMNNTACSNDFLGQFTLGSSYTGYVNPANPYDVRLSVDINMAAGIAVLILFLIAFGLFAFTCYRAVKTKQECNQKNEVLNDASRRFNYNTQEEAVGALTSPPETAYGSAWQQPQQEPIKTVGDGNWAASSPQGYQPQPYGWAPPPSGYTAPPPQSGGYTQDGTMQPLGAPQQPWQGV